MSYSARLSSFHTVSPEFNPFTVYVITVRKSGQPQWQVFRRYGEWEDLRAKLERQVGSAPPMPKKPPPFLSPVPSPFDAVANSSVRVAVSTSTRFCICFVFSDGDCSEKVAAHSPSAAPAWRRQLTAVLR